MNDNILVGKKIVAVYLAEDREAIRFDVEGAEPIIARADGDCCSHTWIEGIEGAERMIGVVTKAEDIPMPYSSEDDKDNYDVIAYYGFQITTDKGDAVIDYRNSSNGYYGGSLSWPGDNYYYGGVFGQNVSNEVWTLIAGKED